MISFDEVMKLTASLGDHRLLEDEEAKALYDCCLQVPKDGLVVEVGAYVGRSSSIIAQVSKAIGYHSVHIDPFVEHGGFLVPWVTMMQNIGHPFTLLCMTTEQAEPLIREIGHYGIDFAYIDGDHYHVDPDVRIVASKVCSGGILAAHDMDMPSVSSALEPFVASGWDRIGLFGRLGVWRRK